MLTSSAHQQSLVSETRPPILERGSYIPWASRFRRYLNRKRETRKFLNHSIDVDPYEFTKIRLNQNQLERPKTEYDLTGDDLKQYEADIKAMNLIIISIPNDIYNSVDSCQTAREMCLRVERLMQGTALNVVDRETRFNNEFDQFIDEPGESLVSVYNPKKLEKTHDTLALVAHTSSSRFSPAYYVTHPPSVIDYDNEYQGETFQNDLEDSHFCNDATCLCNHSAQEIVKKEVELQGHSYMFKDRNCWRVANIQTEAENEQRNLRTSSSGNVTNVHCYNCNEKGHYARNYPKLRIQDSKYYTEQMLLAKKEEAGVILSNEQNDFLLADAA
ncbi:integrase, catalytic region, zinc finger, CCHC-type containing protein [Tanacetum coccineum]